MIVHGPGLPDRAAIPLACCGVLLDDAEPGIVTSDPGFVTCGSSLAAFVEQLGGGPDVLGLVVLSELPGGWLALEGGELTGAYYRDGAWHDIRDDPRFRE